MDRKKLIGAVFASSMVFGSAQASIVYTSSGTSAKGVAVSYEAELTISGDDLVVTLTNNSPVATLNPDDTLSSFYFDIVSDGVRPVLTYVSAVGDVYLGDKDAVDSLVTADADLMAVNSGDGGWAFDTMDDSIEPFLGFGIGTVGNSGLIPNNFQGSIVGAIDYSIFTGDITTSNLDGQLLVRDTAVFTFSGVSGFSEADIAAEVVFGLGTAPDSLLTGVQAVPVPPAVWLFGSGLLGMIGVARRRVPR